MEEIIFAGVISMTDIIAIEKGIRMFVLISTPIGRTENGYWIDYFPSRWSYSARPYRQHSYYPYNLAYLSAYMKQETHHAVKIIDPQYLGMEEDEYISTIMRFNPDVWVVEVDAIIAKRQEFIICELRNQGFNGKILLCGPHPTGSPEEVLSWGVDFVAISEFEQSIVDLAKVNFIESVNIKGIFPNRENNVVDLLKLPFPEDSDIKRRNYCRLPGLRYRQVEMYATRGCPFSCDFCVTTGLYYCDHKQRVRGYDSIINEIRYMSETIQGFEGVFFNDDTHAINTKFIRGLCKKLIKSGLNRYHYSCLTTYSSLNMDVLTLMKQAGYYYLQIGIESIVHAHIERANQTYLQKIDNQKLISVLESARKLNFYLSGTMVFGAMGSTYESDMATLDEVERLYAEGLIGEISVSVAVPFIGTRFYKECAEKGYLSKDIKYDGKTDCPVSYPWYSSDKIRLVFDRANELSASFFKKNQNKGIHFSSWDKEWCAPVFALNDRKPGEMVDWTIPSAKGGNQA